MKLPKTFIGWTNFKWFSKELMKMYSAKETSYFSKKRIESGVAFLIGQIGMVSFLFKKMDTMDVYDFAVWAGMEFLIAGYTVREIQKEKTTRTNENTDRISEEG